MSRKTLALTCALLGSLLACLLMLSMTGCSGNHPTSTLVADASATDTIDGASAAFTIHWPTRGIPTGTNRIIIFVNGTGFHGSLAYIVDHTGVGATTTVNIPIPVGTKRLFSVEARKVTTVKYTQPTQVLSSSSELSEGTLLGSGQDGQAYDVAAGSTVHATVVLSTAGTPDPSVTNVAVTVNQIISDPGRWPAVLVLQIIRDQNGNPLTNLNKGNFEVIEDGKAATITDVRTVTQAQNDISIGMVLDRSGSMDGQPTADLESASSNFVNMLQVNDAAEVINFSTNVEVTQPFTTNKAALLAAISGHYIGDMTALYDAMGRGIQDTAARSGRKAVLAMTDGYENESVTMTQDSVISSAKTAGIPVFIVGLGDVDESALTNITNQTGGLYYYAPASSALTNIYQKVAGQLNGQVQISFISPDRSPSGRLRHVVVKFTYGAFIGQTTYDYIY